MILTSGIKVIDLSSDIISFSIDKNFKLNLNIHSILLLIIFILILLLLLFFKYFKNKLFKSYEIDEAELNIGSGSIKFKPNYDDLQIAYKIYIELSTRKIGLEIDYENDVIYEVYKSWYEFFKITRELIKELPINKIKKYQSSKLLVNIAVEVLNNGLRNHLTKWQAKFNKWFEIETEKRKNESPQQIQRDFIDYDKLIEDMKKTNKILIYYKDKLKEMVL